MPTATPYADMEVNGAYLLGLINSLNEEDVKPFRERHHLTEIDAEKWYPAQQVIDFYNDIANAPGGMFNLIAIGINVVMQLPYPPSVKTLQDAIAAADAINRGAWRGGDAPELKIEMLDERHVRFRFRNVPFPTDLIYGLCFGLVKRFSPPNTHFYVTQTTEEDTYIYNLSW